jgi:nucleotide-binding universal stress UspA family protein
MIKDLVVNLSLGASGAAASAYAISVAEAFRAHIAGIAFAYEPVIPPSTMGASIPPQWIDEQRAQAESAASKAIAKFEDQTRRSGLSVETRKLAATVGSAPELFGQAARRFDLSVVGQAENGKSAVVDDLIIEAALFNSGRPVLVVPYVQTGGLRLERVMVCWDGSRNAARAIADALPFLARSKAIDVVQVTDRTDTGEVAGADIAHHLARHGLKIALSRIAATNVAVADIILSHAADTAVDLLVMGGYGHSRLREFVLGGTTRSILETMTVPTLMAH